MGMKAIVNHEYGPPGVLALEDVDMPVIRRDEVLVRVLAAAVNPGDWDVMHGTPYVLRLTTGLRRPRNKILGLAIAGLVEAVGSNVSKFRPADEVYAGLGKGGFAEYARVPQDALAPKPANLTFEQAAAVTHGRGSLQLPSPVAAMVKPNATRLDRGHREGIMEGGDAA
jgi:NADPH:quinone reductase-like Zn-dependent oxidoreductase